jgi:predicted Ser/Thr protein kinase
MACFTCGVSLVATTVVRQGTVIASRYEILSELGSGGMGVVYKAHDRVLDETVAIKTLRADLTTTTGAAQRFRSEIKLARKVTHRNVCRIHEYGEDGGLRFICMEYVDGVDLKHILRASGGFSTEKALEIALQVAYGLEAIHEAGIIHRDLKTPNIIQDGRGIVRLMDFGIAKELGAGATAATGTGLIVGTPEYMSPEQARGEPVDLRADIYALGIVIFEIFTGRVPFKGDTPMATILKHINDPPPIFEEAAAAVPPAIRPVLARALAKSPDERYPSARAMAEAILAVRGTGAGSVPTRIGPGPDAGATPTRSAAAPTLPAQESAAPTVAAVPATRVERAPARRPRGLAAWAVLGGAAGILLAVGGALLLRSDPAPAPEPTPSRASSPTAIALASPTPSPEPIRTLPPPVAVERTRVPMTAAPRTPVVPTPALPPATTLAASPGGGFLQLVVLPWAEVSVDGREVGRVSSQKLPLGPGAHTVRLVHPDYQPLQRKVTILAGETLKLVIEMPEDAVPRKK